MPKRFKLATRILGVALVLGVVAIALTSIGDPPNKPAGYLTQLSDRLAGALEVEGTKLTEALIQARDRILPAYGSAGSQGRDVLIRDAPTAVLDRDLQAEIEDFIAGRPGTYGVAVRNLITGQTVLINADEVFVAASTYKLLVMYRAYQQMEDVTLSPNEVLTFDASDIPENEADAEQFIGQTWTVAEAIEAMITVSDNGATWALVRRVGGWSSIDAAARELGMDGTFSGGGYYWTTPSDMLTYFETLAQGRLVSPKASRSMLQLLWEQRVNDLIPALLPPEVVVAHKTGTLPGVRNDVGIVFGPRARYIICLFSQGIDEAEAVDVLAQVSLLTYERYDR